MSLKDRTTRLESPRTLRDDAPNTYADKTQPSLQLQRERYHSGLTPRRRHPLEFAFNAAEIPGSSIRSVIHAYNNFNTPAWKRGGEPFLGTNILGQFNNGEEDPSFMNAQRIARPGAGLLEQSAIRLGTDPGFVGNLPALIKAAPGAFRSAYGAVKAARDAAGRRVVPFSQQGYGSLTRQQYTPKINPAPPAPNLENGNDLIIGGRSESDFKNIAPPAPNSEFKSRIEEFKSRLDKRRAERAREDADLESGRSISPEQIEKARSDFKKRAEQNKRDVEKRRAEWAREDAAEDAAAYVIPPAPILPNNKKYRRPDMIEPFREIAPGYRMGSDFWHAKPPPNAWGGNPKPLDPGNRLTPFWRKPPS